MKTITEYLINNHINQDKKYKNPNWYEWEFNNNVAKDEYVEFKSFIRKKYGDLTINSYCKMIKDYMYDFAKLSQMFFSEITEEDVKTEIQYIKKHPKEYFDTPHFTLQDEFVDFIYQNCIK